MNQLVEKMINLSLSSNHYEEIGKLIISYISKYEINVNTTILLFVIVILGSLYFSFFSNNNVSNQKHKLLIKPKPNKFDRTRSWIIREIHSGEPILNRLKEDFNKACVNPATLKDTEKVLKALLNEEYLDLIKIQQAVAKLEMSGSENSAVKKLEEALEKANNANKPHEAYEIEMFLVEMLIYKRDLEKALNRACLKDESLRDARRPLYKAIIHQMNAYMIKSKKEKKKEKKKAIECWEEFVTLRDPPYAEDSYSFKEFKKNVKKLLSAEKELYGKNEQ
ncbi:uncharacterized protein LOC123897929 [Trifolium pratense]|uniref:uncharacterized protein LOC123897929 n=1 Tax=Trifolium pratense TaxID=57577 RepID=UPI001E697D85|nr:uncharacterized protein LOC123897929 [Trifolium pratense]